MSRKQLTATMSFDWTLPMSWEPAQHGYFPYTSGQWPTSVKLPMQEANARKNVQMQQKGAPYVAKATAHVVKGTDLGALATALEATAEYLRTARDEPSIGRLRQYEQSVAASKEVVKKLMGIITADYGLAERASGLTEEEERVLWAAQTFLSL